MRSGYDIRRNIIDDNDNNNTTKNINDDDNKLKNAILSVKNKSEVDPDC